MSGAGTLVVWDDAFLGYDLGADHPMNPVRLELTMALARSLGVLDAPGVLLGRPESAADAVLETVHSHEYVHAVRNAPDDVMGRLFLRFGLGTPDNPVFARMHESSALLAGGTLTAAEAVWSGRQAHAVNIGGGLHHAMRGRASGFCVYNDVAVAIARMLADGAQRVAYVDVDVHHGDGVQAVFYGDPRVLTISLHESGYTLFPGTGFPGETGGSGAEGSSVNVALPAGTGDAGWLRAFDAVVPPLLRAFAPDVLVTQHGCDTHATDPLADLLLSVDGQRAACSWLHDLAHEVAGGRWVAVGGGGYQVATVVPRAWTHLLALACHAPVDPRCATPNAWRSLVHERAPGVDPPSILSDDQPATFVAWDAGTGDPDDPVDRAIVATRDAVFPLHNLDPLMVER